MDEYGGRPHWGKRHYQSAHTLAPRYPDWERFQSVRRRFDPEGRFANDYTDRVLGPVGLAAGARQPAVERHAPGRRASARARAACVRPPAARKGARRVAAAVASLRKSTARARCRTRARGSRARAAAPGARSGRHVRRSSSGATAGGRAALRTAA